MKGITIVKALHSCFLPVRKYEGLDNSRIIKDDIDLVVIRLCKRRFDNEAEKKLFRNQLGGYLFDQIMRPFLIRKGRQYQNPYYLESLNCEVINGIGHFYFPKTEAEAQRIGDCSKNKNRGRVIQTDFRLSVNYEHIRQLQHEETKAIENKEVTQCQ